MPIYPGGVSRRELEQRFRQLEQQLRRKLSDEVKVAIVSSVQSGGSGGSTTTGGGVSTVEYNQGTASTLWEINHNLGRYPVVWTIDSAGTEVHGKVTHISKVKLTVEFSTPFKGKALMI